MWDIEYSNEVKFYLLDNYPYTFDLHVRIETLRYEPDGFPPEGVTPAPVPGTFGWVVLGHLVVYRQVGNLLRILYIKPEA